MRSHDDGIDINAERHYEHWLEATGELARDAIVVAFDKWTVYDIIGAVIHGGGDVDDYDYEDDAPVSMIISRLNAAETFLQTLDAEEAVRVAIAMSLPGDWEYTPDWDPRSL